MIFSFVTKKLFFLGKIPFASAFFDNFMKVYYSIRNGNLPDLIDQIEDEVSQWPGVSVCQHKYGGLEFLANKKEIGHIHGNGFIDLPFSLEVKKKLKLDLEIMDHHKFVKSGWITFRLKDDQSKIKAIKLLKLSYNIIVNPDTYQNHKSIFASELS